LPRLVGLGHAMRLTLTGDMIGAAEAKEIGLVEMVVPHEELRARTMELAQKIASMSPLTVKVAKESLRASERLPIESGLLYGRALLCPASPPAERGGGVRGARERGPRGGRGRGPDPRTPSAPPPPPPADRARWAGRA